MRLLPFRVEWMYYFLGGAGLGLTLVSRDVGTRICLGCSGSWSRYALTGILEPQKAVPQVLTLLGGARFIAWRLKRPFLRDCRRSPRYIWSLRACIGYGPSPRPTKNALCYTRPIRGINLKCRFYKLINIRIDYTSFGYTAFWPISISCKCSC